MQSDQAVYSQGWCVLLAAPSCGSWPAAAGSQLVITSHSSSWQLQLAATAQPRVLTSSSHCVTLAPASSWLPPVSAVALLLLSLLLLLWCWHLDCWLVTSHHHTTSSTAHHRTVWRPRVLTQQYLHSTHLPISRHPNLLFQITVILFTQ